LAEISSAGPSPSACTQGRFDTLIYFAGNFPHRNDENDESVVGGASPLCASSEPLDTRQENGHLEINREASDEKRFKPAIIIIYYYRTIVSVWNFVRMYRPIIESRHKILASGGTFYPTYLDPWVPLFWIFSLLRPATSVKWMTVCEILNRLCARMRYIDWYLNWPYSTLIFWDMLDLLVWKVSKTFFYESDRKKLRFDPCFLCSGPSKLENDR
jgi:hypothetical protein